MYCKIQLKYSCIYVVLFLVLGTTQHIIAQTYFKTVDIFENALSSGFSLSVDNNNIYISSKTACINDAQDTSTCLGISRHNAIGETIWKKRFEWATSGNTRTINFKGDTLVISAHDSSPYHAKGENNYHLLLLNNQGDSLNHFKLEFNEFVDFEDQVFNNGSIVHNHDVFVYGSARLPSDTVAGVIQKVSLDGLISEPKFYTPENGELLPMWDLAFDSSKNLVFIDNFRSNKSGVGTVKKITTIDKEGEILREFLGPSQNAGSSIFPNLTILENGNFFFIHHIPFTAAFTRTEQLICTTSLGDIIWTYDYPSEQFSGNGAISINEVILAINGDVIGCGNRKRDLDDLVQGTDAYLFRISPSGEMLWERYYNIEEENGELGKYSLREVKEMEDQSIVAMGTKITKGLIPILKVDPYGCIDGKDCGEQIILVDTKDMDNQKEVLSYKPNPTNDIGEFIFANSFTGEIVLFDCNLKIIKIEHLKNVIRSKIDMSIFESGIYYARITRENSSSQCVKIVKT